MAVSKTGGTKGKLRGQVGKTIYQVRREDDGTYTQILYQKGERVETQTTPKLQAQRMYTAMVESLMKELKPIGRISFQSGKNKSQSLNAFSSWNLRLVANDAKANWYGSQKFVYPTHYRTSIDIQDLGGPYIISSGSLQYNAFDELFYDEYPRVNWLDVPSSGHQFYGMRFSCHIAAESVGSFLGRHRITRLDTVAMCGLREYLDYNPDPDDPTDYIKHEYIIAYVNNRIPQDFIMTPDVIRELFSFDFSMQPTILFARDGLSFAIGFLADYQEIDERLWYYAAFTISYPRGRKEISSSQYVAPSNDPWPWLADSWPSYVFGSWMGEPQNHNYPSPY